MRLSRILIAGFLALAACSQAPKHGEVVRSVEVPHASGFNGNSHYFSVVVKTDDGSLATMQSDAAFAAGDKLCVSYCGFPPAFWENVPCGSQK